MTPAENWLPIPGWEGYYEASDQGRIRSVDRIIPWNGGFRNRKGRILSPGIGANGYASVSLYRNNHGKQESVHRLIALTFLGPSELTVNHLSGCKTDNRLCNLEYSTR